MSAFALDFSKAIENAKGQTETVIKKVTIELFKSVIEKSPVDTGRFRANWNTSFGTPDLSESDATDASACGEPTVAKMQSTVLKYQLKDQSVFLTNNLPYALRLEDGYSRTQAPNGMVRLSIIEFNAHFANVK